MISQRPPRPGDECQTPFTQCWCETRPNNPNCEKPSVDVNLDITLLLTGTILIILHLNKWKVKEQR